MNQHDNPPQAHRISVFWILSLIGLASPWGCSYYIENNAHAAKAGQTPASAERCQLESVYDGDTAWVVCNGQREKLRLHCIDTPEMQQKPWGTQSRDHLRQLLGGRDVDIERDGKDRYGRTIAVIWQDGTNMNLQMAKDGWAAPYPKYCKEPAYFDGMKAAQSRQAGIWSERGLHQTPWEWRKK